MTDLTLSATAPGFEPTALVARFGFPLFPAFSHDELEDDAPCAAGVYGDPHDESADSDFAGGVDFGGGQRGESGFGRSA